MVENVTGFFRSFIMQSIAKKHEKLDFMIIKEVNMLYIKEDEPLYNLLSEKKRK